MNTNANITSHSVTQHNNRLENIVESKESLEEIINTFKKLPKIKKIVYGDKFKRKYQSINEATLHNLLHYIVGQLNLALKNHEHNKRQINMVLKNQEQSLKNQEQILKNQELVEIRTFA